jgi:peroxiredoxin
MKIVTYAATSLVSLVLLGLFARAVPEALLRARAGERRGREAACEQLQPTSENPTLGRFPQHAPDFMLKDYAGRALRLSSLRGTVVLVNFWATWCETCVVEMPAMERLSERMRGKPFRLLAVSIDDGWEPIREFFAKGTSLQVLLDSSQEITRRYGTERFPESYIIDKDGYVRYYIVSNRDWDRDDVAACLDALME